MSHNLTLVLAVLGAVMLPFSLLIWWIYRAIQTADEPAPAVISFQPAFWGFDSIYLGFLACLTFSIPLLIIWKSIAESDFGVLAFLPLAVLPGIAPFVYLRLHWAYWQHDKNHFIVFCREENRFVYGADDASASYNISDVAQLTHHKSTRSKFSFAYTVVSFHDGTALIFTSLLCDKFTRLLPDVKCEEVQSWYPWLPDDH